MIPISMHFKVDPTGLEFLNNLKARRPIASKLPEIGSPLDEITNGRLLANLQSASLSQSANS